MKGIVARPGMLAAELFEELSEPEEPVGNEVVCCSLEVGVCGTDREIIATGAPMHPPSADYLLLGHECLAQVIESGPESRFQGGDYVVPLVRRPHDPTCQRPDLLGFGEFTERGIVFSHGFSSPLWIDDEQYLLPVDTDLLPVAVLTEPISIAAKGINEASTIQSARIEAAGYSWHPPRVLVTGLGPIAFAAVLVARARGWATTVAGRDPKSSRRAHLVSDFGARYISTDDLVGLGNDDEFDLMLECTGSDRVILAASVPLAPRAIGVWLASSRLPESRLSNVDQFVRNSLLGNHLHLGCVNSARRDFVDALRYLRYWQSAHPSLLPQLVTERVPIESAAWHFTNRQPQGIKVVVAYEQP